MGGGGSLGKSESDESNQSQFNQNVWEPQGNALQGLYGQMGNLFNQTNNQVQGQIPGAVGQQQDVFNQANPAWQQQLGGGAFQGMDLQNQYNQDRQGGGNEQFIDQSIMGGAGNNYADAMKNQLAGDSMDRLGRQYAQSDLRASNAGQSGSSRHGLLQADMARKEMDRLGEQQTGIGFNSFDKDLDRKLGIAQRADQFDMGRLQQSGNMLGQQQAAMQGGLGAGKGMQQLGMGQFAPSQVPWQAAGNYANSIGGPTILGSGSGSGDSSSKGFGMSGQGGAKGG
jgi:hypothetical protein